jgi:hypothetical protein
MVALRLTIIILSESISDLILVRYRNFTPVIITSFFPFVPLLFYIRYILQIENYTVIILFRDVSIKDAEKREQAYSLLCCSYLPFLVFLIYSRGFELPSGIISLFQ